MNEKIKCKHWGMHIVILILIKRILSVRKMVKSTVIGTVIGPINISFLHTIYFTEFVWN